MCVSNLIWSCEEVVYGLISPEWYCARGHGDPQPRVYADGRLAVLHWISTLEELECCISAIRDLTGVVAFSLSCPALSEL